MAEGDIGTVIDSLEFATVLCDFPDIIHVSGSVFAIAHGGDNLEGFLKTVTIADDGQIDNTVIDSYKFDAVNCEDPRLIHINGDVYAIAYQGPNSDGYLKTFTIADDGQITEPYIDSWCFDAGLGYRPHIIHIFGTIYAIVYRNLSNDGTLVTLSISDGGTITKSIIDSLTFGPSDAHFCRIIHVGGLVYAIAFRDGNSDCTLVSVTIHNDGQIDNTVIDSYLFHAGTFYNTKIIHISGSVFAVVYHDIDNDAWLTTITIAGNGQITEPFIDRYEFEPASGTYPFIIHVSGSVYVIAYTGGGSGGWIKTVTIADDGQITEPFIDSGEFDNVSGVGPCMLHVSGGVYAIAYKGADGDGFLKTITIETVEPRIPQHLMLMGVG